MRKYFSSRLSALLILLFLTIPVTGCDVSPPSKDGVWLLDGDVYKPLVRIAVREISRSTLRSKTLASIPRMERFDGLAMRGAVKPNIVEWRVLENIAVSDKSQRKGVASLEPHKEDESAILAAFDPGPPKGYIVFRISGGTYSGWYPVVVEDSSTWALLEGKSLFANKKYAQALASFDRSIDQDESSMAYWYKAQSLISLKKTDKLLSVAKKALSEAKDSDDIVLLQILLAESYIRSGNYAKGLEIFDSLKRDNPGDKRVKTNLGRLLAGVEPSPASLVEQVYAAARKQGADGVEDYLLPSDIVEQGEAGITEFTKSLNQYGAVKNLQIRSEKRFGRLAKVEYSVRFAKGTKLDRTMKFFLDDSGRYKAHLD